MKSKKIVSSKFWLIFGVIFIIALIAVIPLEIQTIASRFATTYDIVMFGMCLLVTLIIAVFLFIINRLSCLVWYENGTLKRKGLFWGFEKEVKIEDIDRIEVTTLSRDATYFVFVDGNSRHGNERIRKDSFICIQKTDKNRQFIRSFWNGRIGNYVEKENDPWA